MLTSGKTKASISEARRYAVGLVTRAAVATSVVLASTSWAQGMGATPADGTQTLTKAAVSAYAEGRNAEAARLGLLALELDPNDFDLRLKTANALAWDGQHSEALRQYEQLLATPLKSEATLGVANVNLWRGLSYVAVPLYASLLSANPANADAIEGMKDAKSQLRPRTEIRAFTMNDSEDSERELLSISHQWRSEDMKRVYEVIIEGGRESRGTEVPDLKPRDVAFTVEDFSLPLSPKVKIELQDSPLHKGFAELAVKLTDDINFEVGSLNWTKVAFAPLSRRDGLGAYKVGIGGKYNGSLGHISGKFTRFAISDGNVIQTAAAEYWPYWQPLLPNSGVRLFTGLFTYKADRNVERYWSPAAGHTIAFVGGAYGKWEKEYEIFASIKRNFLIAGEGTGGTSISMGGKRWLTKDWAMRGEAFFLDSDPLGKGYRSHSLMVALQRYW